MKCLNGTAPAARATTGLSLAIVIGLWCAWELRSVLALFRASHSLHSLRRWLYLIYLIISILSVLIYSLQLCMLCVPVLQDESQLGFITVNWTWYYSVNLCYLLGPSVDLELCSYWLSCFMPEHVTKFSFVKVVANCVLYIGFTVLVLLDFVGPSSFSSSLYLAWFVIVVFMMISLMHTCLACYIMSLLPQFRLVLHEVYRVWRRNLVVALVCTTAYAIEGPLLIVAWAEGPGWLWSTPAWPPLLFDLLFLVPQCTLMALFSPTLRHFTAAGRRRANLALYGATDASVHRSAANSLRESLLPMPAMPPAALLTNCWHDHLEV
eukprot:TRINITY_DN83728_c0_g1_i1.p1 TRINITY_DN83728_c0_g1~~TRINITY_DN83728_c0_g1_i1.p1  ORF type:complete len:322 (-),score=26.24 TRINITY_DN83728_c0_g1_i1:19-984(-)